MNFPNLLSGTSCGLLQLKNRLLMAPVFTGLENSGSPQELAHFYGSRVADGVSMVTVAGGVVHFTGTPFLNVKTFDAQRDGARHRAIVRAVHANEGSAVLQLSHAGPAASGFLRFGPGPRASKLTGRSTLTCPIFILEHFIRRFAKTAADAIRLGYDGVEIDASCDSLVAAYSSPATNDRTDVWGSSQLARFKLAIDVVRAVKKEIPKDKALGFRFNLFDFSAKGANWDETTRYLNILKNAGVDYFCAEMFSTGNRIPTKLSNAPAGVWNNFYEKIAVALQGHPIVVGQHLSPLEDLEKFAARHPNVLFELSRDIISDSQFLHKHTTGFSELVSPCLGCIHNCIKRPGDRNAGIRCPVNPFLFADEDLVLSHAAIPRSVVIVGGGIAGMTTALFAAKRGHSVRLFEAGEELGGQLRLMSRVPGKENIGKWLDRIEDRLKALDVEIIRNRTIVHTDIVTMEPSVTTIIATGSISSISNIDVDGLDSSNVITWDELLGKKAPVGKRVAVIGTNRIALDVCRYLVETAVESRVNASSWLRAWGIDDGEDKDGDGRTRFGILGVIPEIAAPSRQVYLCEMDRHVTDEILSSEQNRFEMRWLLMRGVQTMRDATLESVDNYNVRISFGEENRDSALLRIDHAVVCCGLEPVNDLAIRLELSELKTKRIGACAQQSGYASIVRIVEDALALAISL